MSLRERATTRNRSHFTHGKGRRARRYAGPLIALALLGVAAACDQNIILPNDNVGTLRLCECIKGDEVVKTTACVAPGGTFDGDIAACTTACDALGTEYLGVSPVEIENPSCNITGETHSPLTATRTYPLAGGTSSGSATLTFDGYSASASVQSVTGAAYLDSSGKVSIRDLEVHFGDLDFGGGETVTGLVVDAFEWTAPLANGAFSLSAGSAVAADMTGNHKGDRASAHLTATTAATGTFDPSTGALSLQVQLAGNGVGVTLSLTAAAAHVPPVASAGPDQHVVAACSGTSESSCVAQVTLDASATHVSGSLSSGAIASLEWTRLSPLPQASLASGWHPTVALTQGKYTVGLGVLDNGLSDSAQMHVTVTNPPITCYGFTACEGVLTVSCPQSNPPDEPDGFYVDRWDSSAGWTYVDRANFGTKSAKDPFQPSSSGNVTYRACADAARTNCSTLTAYWSGPENTCNPTGMLHCKKPLVGSCCANDPTNCACVARGHFNPDC